MRRNDEALSATEIVYLEKVGGMCMFRGSLVTLAALTAAVCGDAWADWASDDSYGAFHVVVADSASASEKFAAQEFKKYWRLTTGHDIPVQNKPTQGVTVWIGRDGVPSDLLARLELEGLGPDGLCIRTVKAGRTKTDLPDSLLIVGGRERGTMYGVYEFFERYMGVRWLAAGVTHIPEAPPDGLPKINYRYVPQFLRRRTGYAWGFRVSGREKDADEIERLQRLASHVQYGLHVHTLFTLLPPDKYFDEHPEYYSEIDGKRTAERGQLCFSNTDMTEALVAELEERMRANPTANVWNVSQMDWDGHCECSECRAIDEREGGHMASLLTFINRVADAVKDEFPNNYIETLAYQHTRKPPKFIRPRENVIIALCNIECEFSMPMTDRRSAVNRAFLKDIKGWAKIPCIKFFWDYPDNVVFQAPFPNFHVMQPNMQLWADSGFTSAYICSNHNASEQFGAMKAYLFAKLMWNPDCDFDGLMKEFIDLYYGEGGPYIEQYIDLLTQALRKKRVEMDIFDHLHWIDYDLVTESDAIFQRALAAATAPEVTLRLRQEYASVQYQAMIAAPKLEVDTEKMWLTVVRPPCLSFDAYARLLDELGVPPAQGMTHRQNIERWVGSRALPPSRLESPIEVIEDEHSLLWVAPAAQGTILRWRDKSAGVELLDNIRKYGKPGHVFWHKWQETRLPPIGPRAGAIAEEYTVKARQKDAITLEAALDNGLVFERIVKLMPDRPGLEYTASVFNPTDAPVSPGVNIHPEFYTHGAIAPEMWADTGAGWVQLNGAVNPDLNVFGAFHDPRQYVRWAAYIPTKRFTLVNAFEDEGIASLMYFYNAQREQQHINLELMMSQEPVQPGDKRTIVARYYTSRQHPSAMQSGNRRETP